MFNYFALILGALVLNSNMKVRGFKDLKFLRCDLNNLVGKDFKGITGKIGTYWGA